LAAEAATNAIKFAGRPDGLAAEIVVKLFAVPEGDVVLTISNTIGAPLLEGSETDLGGLGMRLIDGFIAQLGGRMETTVTDTHHRMTLRFLPLLEARVAESDSAGLSFYGSGNRDLLKGGRKSG
jgi:two-component sensor histidine kinase